MLASWYHTSCHRSHLKNFIQGYCITKTPLDVRPSSCSQTSCQELVSRRYIPPCTCRLLSTCTEKPDEICCQEKFQANLVGRFDPLEFGMGPRSSHNNLPTRGSIPCGQNFAGGVTEERAFFDARRVSSAG